MIRRYWRIFVLLGLIGSFLLVNCSGGGTDTEVDNSPTETTTEDTAESEDTTDAAKEPVTLTFIKITDELEAQAYAVMLEEFQKIENGRWSHVDILYDTKPFAELFRYIETTVATGQPVDIIQADGPDVKHFAWNGVIMDLTDHFSEEELAQWFPQSIAEGSYNGRFYGAPHTQSCQLLYYNQDYVDAAGLELGKEGLTYGPDGTGLPVWQKLTQDEDGDGNPEVYGLRINGPAWFDYFNGIAARTNGEPGSPTYNGVSPDGLGFVGYFDTPEAIESYRFDQALVFDYKVRSSEPPPNALFAGFAAMDLNSGRQFGTWKDQFADFPMNAMQPPYWVTPMCHTGSWHYAISPTTEHFEEALAFIKFASSDAGAQILFEFRNQEPANVNLFNNLPEFQEAPRSYIKDMFVEYGAPRIESPAYTEYNALFTEFYQALMSGGDAEALAQEYAQLMEAAAASYKE